METSPHLATSLPRPPRSKGAAIFLIVVGATGVVILSTPVFPGLTLAAVLATLLEGLHRRIGARVRNPGLAAGLSTAGATLVILLPLAIILFVVGSEAMSAIQWFSTRQGGVGGATVGVEGVVARLAMRVGVNPESVVAALEVQGRRIAEIVAGRTLLFLSGIPGVLLQFGVALVTLFYMLRDGDAFMAGFRRVVPLDPARTDELLARAREITYATVYGNVLVAIVQGIIGGVAFRLLGIPAAALWGTIMAILAMIPMVGPPVVWIPASIYLAATGQWQRALILVAVGALIIGTVDNIIRSIFVGGRARVHSLVVFLSVLGGVLVFGAAGVVVGPVMFVLALISIEAGRLALRPYEQVGTGVPSEVAGG